MMEECALTSAYVLVRDDGSLLAYNCRAEMKKGTLRIVPAEAIVSKIHINTPRKLKIDIRQTGRERVHKTVSGCQWIYLK